MGKFASAAKQAASVMKEIQGRYISSVGTVRNYEQALTTVAAYAKVAKTAGGLRGMTPEKAMTYLEIRGQEVSQSTLNMERQAIQAMMQYVTGKLEPKQTLPVIKSEIEQTLKSKAYTSEQVKMIRSHQTERNALATEIAHAAGLRAHELLTLRPANEQPMSDRPVLDTKWAGREGQIYTVAGKGGLVREVLIPCELAERLEARRLPYPIQITDRNIHYRQHYDINGGQRFSNAFSSASKRALYRSSGAHGVRHGYAQERMQELQVGQLLTRDKALETVSQEMGHFRPEITEAYLR